MRFHLQDVNPLRDLDLEKLARRLENGERGYYALLQWTYRAVEKRDPTVRAVKRRLLSALGALKWSVKISEDVKKNPQLKEKADAQAATLRAAYDMISNLRAALNFLSLVELRGFSHLEKIYRKYGSEDPDARDVIELRIVPQWLWCRDGIYGAWNYNPSAQEVNRAQEVDLSNFIVHEIDDPVGEIFAELKVKRGVTDTDWDAFLEDYGVPALFVVLPPNIPKEKEPEYQRLAERAVSMARGALPHGATLTSPSAQGAGGAGIFKERLEYLDGQIVIAGTSGKLTVLAESGSGTLAGGAQKDAFDEIAQAIADQISGVMQLQFDKPLLEEKYPGDPILAYFEFAPIDEKETARHADNAVKFGQAGYAIEDAHLSEVTGYPLRYVGAQAAHTNRPDGSKPIGVGEQTEKQLGADKAREVADTPPAPGGAAAAAAPEKSASISGTPVEKVASTAGVAAKFIAPGAKLIDDLIARASDDAIGVEDIAAAAEQMLATIPELADQIDVDSLVDALQAAMVDATEQTLAGVS